MLTWRAPKAKDSGTDLTANNIISKQSGLMALIGADPQSRPPSTSLQN